MKHIKVIIGKNFGDEGKGLMTAYFAKEARKAGSCLVIKHNGGAQAGHTVACDGARFVFHQLGSGSCYGCPTFLTDTFFVDLLKIEEEINDFRSAFPAMMCPDVYAMSTCRVTVVYDVLLNRLAESMRGDQRHGSCGMGIREADLRSATEIFSLRLDEVHKLSIMQIADKLASIRDVYVVGRLREMGITDDRIQQMNTEQKEWIELIYDDNVRMNAAYIMKENLVKYIRLVASDKAEIEKFLDEYDTAVFESAQGLLLDCDNIDFYPHLTPSKTGGRNVWNLLQNYTNVNYTDCDGEVCYVTRSYVTRHGAGRLPYACTKEALGDLTADQTNQSNEWQGNLRYACFGSTEEFMEPIVKDLKETPQEMKISLAITHLDETGGKLCTCSGMQNLSSYLGDDKKVFGGNVYLSYAPDTDNVKME